MTEPPEGSLQDTFGPDFICYGCGPANEKGLQLKSFVKNDELFAEWTPRPEHLAFPDILNGGIIGTLLDCHSNWTAWWTLYQRDGTARPMPVTARYEITLLSPTPLQTVTLRARPIEVGQRSVRVEAELIAAGERRATCGGTFVRPRSPSN